VPLAAAVKAASMAEWDRCVCDACKRYDKDQVNTAVSEIAAHDANYYRLPTPKIINPDVMIFLG
jgi:hypothetical protein